MLSKLKFNSKSLGICIRQCTNLNLDNNFRVAVENENHQATENEKFKYKNHASENFLSSNQIAERLTSFVQKIEIIPSPTTEIVKNQPNTMSEVSRDCLGQWPLESESEMSGQGLQRLRNGRFNKVSWKFLKNRFYCLTMEKFKVV